VNGSPVQFLDEEHGSGFRYESFHGDLRKSGTAADVPESIPQSTGQRDPCCSAGTTPLADLPVDGQSGGAQLLESASETVRVRHWRRSGGSSIGLHSFLRIGSLMLDLREAHSDGGQRARLCIHVRSMLA
jgi:hypothetical protein